jgi:hypothetical protein
LRQFEGDWADTVVFNDWTFAGRKERCLFFFEHRIIIKINPKEQNPTNKELKERV